MSPDIWAAFAIFTLVAVITPGPNNLLLLTSGLRLGVRASLPFIFGISVGYCALLIAMGFGLGQLFQQFPLLQLALRIAGTAYFLYLGWTLLRPAQAAERPAGRTMGFFGGITFQAINPKAWLMCMTAIALYLPSEWSVPTLVLMAAISVLLGIPANLVWASGGQLLRPLLNDVRRMRIFNGVMAALLILSILPVWVSVS